MKQFLKVIVIPFSLIINLILKRINIFIIYRYGKAIGDQVCMTGAIKLIDEQYQYKIIVISNYPEIFYNNPRVWKCFDFNSINKFLKFVLIFLKFIRGSQVENFLFKNEQKTLSKYMSKNNEELHLIQLHSRHFKNKLIYNNVTCEIYFSNNELEKFKSKFNLPKNYGLIQPLGKISYTPNKEWGFENFQSVVNNIPEVNWLQVGLSHDTLLDNVEDYRGKTELRELFYLVKNSQFILSNEGLLNHISSSFDTKSIVVFSGFSNICLAQYHNTVSIYNNNLLDCKPCWKLDECNIEGKPCLDGITFEMVATIIKSMGFK